MIQLFMEAHCQIFQPLEPKNIQKIKHLVLTICQNIPSATINNFLIFILGLQNFRNTEGSLILENMTDWYLLIATVITFSVFIQWMSFFNFWKSYQKKSLHNNKKKSNNFG